MTYEDAVEAKVSKTEAEREIKKHRLDMQDFIRDCGDCAQYEGKTVLDWLGY